jgi:outer membrane protein assembly factor BamB
MFHHDLNHTGYSTGEAPRTNITLWSYNTGGSVYSPPAVAGGVVYVGSADGNIYALNATTSALIWTYTTGGMVYSSPAVADGVVYVGSVDHSVYALNATTSTRTRLIWSYRTGDCVMSSPSFALGVVYVGSLDNNVYAINATTGKPVWSYTTGGSVESSPAVADGVVYVGSGDKSVYAINATTGKPVWSYRTGGPVYSSPAVADGVVYVGSLDDDVYALNATTGALIWRHPTSDSVQSSPAVADDMVFVGSDDAKVYALNATTSALIWTYKTSGEVMSSPAVAGNVVYIGSLNYLIYAFYYLAVSISPTSPPSIKLDLGQSKLFKSLVSNGTPPYIYQWYLNGALQAISANWNFTPSSSGSYLVYVNVSDSAGFRAKSNVANAIANLMPSARFAPVNVTMDVNQSQPFALIVSAGTPPYSYKSVPNCVPGPTNSTWTFIPVSPGTYSVYVNVTDSVSVKVKSNVATVEVNPLPSVNVSPTNVTIDVGQSQLFTSIVSNGTSSYYYQWYLNGVAVLGATSPSWTFKPLAAGKYSVSLIITDARGAKASSKIVPVYVRSAPIVSISPRSATVEVNQSQLFNSTVSPGTGTPPFTYQWYLDGAAFAGATDPTWNFTPTSKGLQTIYLIVTDSDGIQAKSQVATITSVIPGDDITLLNASMSKTIIGQNYTANLNVMVINFGNNAETFNVTVYANITAIATQTITLASGNFTTITFTWDTKGFSKGYYTIRAYAWPLLGQASTADKTFVYPVTVVVTIPGDVDGDGHVTILDVVRITSIYGVKLGNPNFNSNCDIDGDDQITILDVVLCASHYGQKW